MKVAVVCGQCKRGKHRMPAQKGRKIIYLIHYVNKQYNIGLFILDIIYLSVIILHYVYYNCIINREKINKLRSYKYGQY